MMGADISSYLSFSYDLKHPSSKSKGTSFASRLVKSSDFAKVLNKLSVEPNMP